MKKILILLVFVSNVAMAQDFWTAMKGPYGAAAADHLVLSSGAILVASQSNGLWRSTDQGATWTRVAIATDASFSDLDLDPLNNNTVYLLNNSGAAKIFKSTDGGLTWANLNSTGLPVGTNKIRVASANRFYAVTSGSVVYRSTNGGTSFNLASTDLTTNVNDLDVSPLNPDHVYASTSSSGVRISEDGGFTFSAATVSGSISTTDNVIQLVFASNGVAYALTPTGPHKKTNTTPGTNAWVSMKGTIPESSFGGTIALNPTGTNLFLANIGSNKLYVTPVGSNFGSTGITFPNHFLPNNLTAISDTQLFMTSQTLGPFYSTNGGTSWSEATGNMTAFSQRAAAETPQGRFFIAHSGFGYLQTIDNGETWTAQATSPANRYINGFLRLNDGSMLAYGPSGTIRSTGTIGNAWAVQNANGIQQAATYDGVNLFAYSGASLLKSSDMGVTWPATAITGLNNTIADIQIDAYNTAWVRTVGNTLYKITNGSTTATQVGGTVSDFSIYSANGATPTVVAILSGSTSMSYSTDGGANFSFRAIPASNAAVQIFAYRRNVVMTTNGGNNISISYNGGSTWQLQPLPETTARITDLTRLNGDRILVTTSGGSSYVSTATVIPPAAPTALSILSLRSTNALLQWTDNADNEVSFVVERSNGDNANFTEYTTANGGGNAQNKFAISVEAVPNTDVYYRVYARNGAGNSATTNEILVRSASPCVSPVPIPSNRSWSATVTPDVGSATNGPGPFTSPAILILEVGNSVFQADEYSLASNFFQVGANPPTRPLYNDALNIVDECGSISTSWQGISTGDLPNGNGSWNSNTKTLTLKWQSGPSYQAYKATTTFVLNATDPIPYTPTMKTFVYSNTEVLISWTFVGFETRNKIYRATVSGGPYTLVKTIDYPLTFFIDKGLTPGATYFYKVTAENASGESPQSLESAVTIGATLFRPVENEIQANYESQQGISWIDIDGDGDEDLASPSFVDANQQSRTPVFYENAGGGSFIRKDPAAVAGENIDVTRGVGVFDFNNDGKLDMYLAKNNNITPDYLLMNDGNWNFTKKQLPEVSTSGTTFRGMGIIDFDRDGFADILLGNDNGGANPATFKPVLAKNVGGNNISLATTSGITDLPLNTRSLGFADFDNDGDTDVLMLNQSNTLSLPNVLFKNNGNGTFSKVTGTVLDTDLPNGSRTCSWGDIDNDGDMDVFIGNQGSSPDILYRNNGDGTFVNIASAVAETTATYGSAFGDIDNDGDIDLIVVNSTANGVFINNGTGVFTKYTGSEVLTHPEIPNIGGAFGDYDKDGFLDFVAAKTSTGAVNMPNMLLKNTYTASASRNWLQIKLVGTVSNRAAIGARVKVVTTSPARTQIREVQSLTGYGSSSSLIVHFGLGTATSVSSIEVRWPNGNVQTFGGVTSNQIITLTEDFTKPTLVLSPANGATNVKVATSSLTITPSETVTAVAGKYISIYKATDLVNAVYHLEATSGTLANGVYTFPLANKLELGVAYKGAIDAGAFRDGALNPNDAITTDNWAFTASPGPLVSAQVPAVAATLIPINTNFELTFNGPVTAVAGKKLIVKDQSTVLFEANVGTTGTVTGNKYLLLSPQALPYLRDLTVTVDPGAFLDVDGNEFKGISNGWTFQTIPEPDLTKPTVNFDDKDIKQLTKGFAPVTINITAFDNIAVTTVALMHRKISSSDWQAAPATKSQTVATGYTVTITSDFADEMGFEYYIVANDEKGNQGRFPADNTNLTSRVKFGDGTLPTITFPSGGTKESWTVISVPYDLPAFQIATVLTSIGTSSGSTWKLIQYKAGSEPGEWIEYPTAILNFERGQGYFINSKLTANNTVQLTNAVAPAYTRGGLFKMNFKKGWNQIGNPYLVNLNWEDIRAYNGANATLGSMSVFTNGTYGKDQQLQVGRGGFVFAQADVANVEFSFTGQTKGGARTTNEFRFGDLSSESWLVSLGLEQGEVTSDVPGVGMHPLALQTYDQLDDFSLPRFGDFIEARFNHPEHFYRKFARDVVTTQQEYTWEFEIETSRQEMATIKWDNSSFGNGPKELYLYHIGTQTPVNMRDAANFSFDPASGNRFRVYYGDDVLAKIRPEKAFLGVAFPNPTSSTTTIPFSLPENNGTFAVRLEVFDMLGRKVATPLQSQLGPGFYKADWQASEGNPGGMYIYKLTIGSPLDGSATGTTLSGKILLKR